MIYKVSPNAVFETFDEEVVVINLVSGSYYALDAAALEIWSLLQEGRSLTQIVSLKQARASGEPDAIRAALTAFARELEREDLIVALPEVVAAPALLDTPVAFETADAERPPFEAPTLTKFTDMQDLLLLDPIHEVDDLGWPHAKPAPQSPASNSNPAPSSGASLD